MKILIAAAALLLGLLTAMALLHESDEALSPEEYGLGELPESSGKAKNIKWVDLRGLNYKSGKVDKNLKKILRQKVRLPGFVVPLDLGGQVLDENSRQANSSDGNEFLLVPTYGACIHTPPPPANQMVLVQMGKGVPVPKRADGPVWVEGILNTFDTKTAWGTVGFEIKPGKTEPYKGGY